MFKVFIDGEFGTTGLEIKNRLKNRSATEVLSVSKDLRKNERERLKLYDNADIVFLCLPDEESKSIVKKAKESTRIIDASTAHRVDSRWTYGLSELRDEQKDIIAKSNRVANPGCHATGAILLMRPLLDADILSSHAPMSVHSLTGYSGGGKGMIARYESKDDSEGLVSPGQYGLNQQHKHLPEITKYSGLSQPPVFTPVVANYYRGMSVSIPLHASMLTTKMNLAGIRKIYEDRYGGKGLISVVTEESVFEGGFLYADRLKKRDDVRILVCGNDDRMTLIAVYDNLGKGASGAAIQNMNLMLGLPEYEGLSI